VVFVSASEAWQPMNPLTATSFLLAKTNRESNQQQHVQPGHLNIRNTRYLNHKGVFGLRLTCSSPCQFLRLLMTICNVCSRFTISSNVNVSP
jgi:hypothetical protein